jgi:hypothetical protein
MLCYVMMARVEEKKILIELADLKYYLLLTTNSTTTKIINI